MRRLIAAPLTALLLCAAAGAGEGVPDSATIREKVAAAGGPVALQSHQTLDIEDNGEQRSVRIVRRGRDWRQVDQTGPFHAERGSEKGQAWHQNENGQTVLDQPDPGLDAREATTTTVTRVHEPVDGFALATLSARGDGVREFVEAGSWHLVRREVLSPIGTAVTRFEDFRLDHGRTFAHRWTVDNSINHVTSKTRVAAYDDGPVAPDEVAIPKPRRALVEFPAGSGAVTVPATFEPDHIAVRVTMNGKGYDFVLDTGASGIIIDGEAARELGLREYGKSEEVNAQRYAAARSIIPEMRIGELRMRDVAVRIAPTSANTPYGVREVGLLGFDFLAELGVTIDYERKRVTVEPEAGFAPPADPRRTELDVRLGANVPMTTVSVNGALGERWIVDTGAAGAFLIFDYFARRHPEAIRNQTTSARSVLLRGVGGIFRAQPYQISSLKIANIDFTDFAGFRVAERGSFEQPFDGLIGPVFLRLFTVYLDYGNSRITLIPNANGRRSMRV